MFLVFEFSYCSSFCLYFYLTFPFWISFPSPQHIIHSTIYSYFFALVWISSVICFTLPLVFSPYFIIFLSKKLLFNLPKKTYSNIYTSWIFLEFYQYIIANNLACNWWISSFASIVVTVSQRYKAQIPFRTFFYFSWTVADSLQAFWKARTITQVIGGRRGEAIFVGPSAQIRRDNHIYMDTFVLHEEYPLIILIFHRPFFFSIS